jgi:hypothetical protein
MTTQYDLKARITDKYRHWHPQSQKIAGGDCLRDALSLGWTLNPLVMVDTVQRSGGRRIHLYYFELTRGDECVTMPVVSNPYVERVIAEHHLTVSPIERLEILHSRHREKRHNEAVRA